MKYFTAFLLFLTSFYAFATHNRAGEITYRQIGVNQVEIKLVTYTREQTQADRPIIDIRWGDGTLDSLERSVGFPELIADDINKNEYLARHTYPGPGTYTITLEDPNRNAGVVNIPNSVSVPFFIQSEIVLNPFLGNNNSPVLLNPPIENACENAIFQHNPSAFDEEGDSLVYSLVNARGAEGNFIDGYSLPNGVTIDRVFGTLTWDRPVFSGEFNFAILIEEYRNGFKIGSVLRDMQVTVAACDNNPPDIRAVNDICVIAGSSLSIPVFASDPDVGDAITLTASGGPLTEVNGDVAVFSEVIGVDSVTGNFTWQTGCEHVRLAPYTVFFRAQDNSNDVQLVDIEGWNIRVIGPKTNNFEARSILDGTALAWQRNVCQEVVGYKIYRRISPSNWIPDSCETGVPGDLGFSLITNISGRNVTGYVDQTVIAGNTYCYRIVAVYADGSESIASDESCAEVIEIQPIPLNADVTVTDEVAGEVFVRWRNPINLDSLNLSAPFRYELYTLIGSERTSIYTSSGLIDTTFVLTNANTEEPLNFALELYSNDVLVSSSVDFSTVFLQTSPADRTVFLTWEYSVPWMNDTFFVYRNSGSGFQIIDTIVGQNSYQDSELTNGEEYCYYIESVGGYRLVDTLRNKSQQVCEVPIDLIPPCLPTINTSSNCIDRINTISWTLDTSDCNGDLSSIQIYFKRFVDDDYALISTIDNPWVDTVFVTGPLTEAAGCYVFEATDSVGNNSNREQEICFDNCPVYELPNVFTPNGDAFNELLIPFPYDYVEAVDITIYNRWGQQVFKSSDLDVLWDGRNMFTNLNSSAGVYYYTCIVTEQRLSGLENKIINGFVHLMR